MFFSRYVGSDNPETYFTDTERTRVVSFDLSLEIIALVYAKLVSATRKKLILSGENSAGKVITHVHFHCVLQTSRYPVDTLSLSSQSEHAKMDIHWFGIC